MTSLREATHDGTFAGNMGTKQRLTQVWDPDYAPDGINIGIFTSFLWICLDIPEGSWGIYMLFIKWPHIEVLSSFKYLGTEIVT